MAPLDRRHNREILDLLIEKASIQGYLTTDDLLDVSPEVGGGYRTLIGYHGGLASPWC
jgi:hypothetical protein